MKIKRKACLNFLSFLVLLFLVGVVFNDIKDVGNKEPQNNTSSIKKDLAKEYQKCLELEYDEKMNTEEFNNKLKKIEENLKAQNVSLLFNSYYKDFRYTFQADRDYYGASLYKLVDINYMIEDSNNKGYSLSSKPVVKSWMERILNVSSNEAHNKLAAQIGLENLRNYAKNLGAKHVMDYRYFGNLDVYDVEVYMNNIYRLMNLNNDNSNFLKKWMNNPNQNSLNINEVSYYHKYGMYNEFYHNAGIAISDKPYLIIVLSYTRFLDEKAIFNKISRDFYNLNLELENNQITYCQNLIYNGEDNG